MLQWDKIVVHIKHEHIVKVMCGNLELRILVC